MKTSSIFGIIVGSLVIVGVVALATWRPATETLADEVASQNL